jgi:VIT1/CCC1 family predicted Fe2+/Mn2+ transporter
MSSSMSWAAPRLRAVAERGFDGPWLRSMLVEVNDGIIATAGIVEGLAGAGISARTTLIAGFSSTIAGGIALAGARYAEEAAELEARLAVIDEERRQISLSPDEEMAELAAIYERKGLSAALAREVAAELTARDALAAHAEAEHGLDLAAARPTPVVTAVAAGLSFAAGSVVPLLSAVLVPYTWRVAVTFLAVIISLSVTSLVLAATGGTPVRRTVLRSVVIGTLAMVLTLVGGTLVHR